ncbi:MAG: hypothetical protein GXY20_06195, partial [Clostridiales bacterium]|nr:hypothetical protein [Clostridiales bacterium]
MKTKTGKKLLSLLMAAIIILTLLPVSALASAFSDTDTHWASSAIDRWSSLGIIRGFNSEFRPNDPITRGEMAVIIDRLMDYQTASINTFSDLGQAFYTDAVLKLNEAGVMLGYGGLVRPTDNITRQDAAVMLGRALGIKESSAALSFTDAAFVSSYAKGYVAALAAKGYINGYNGAFNPKNDITRAEVVTILNNAISGFLSEAEEYTGAYSGVVIVNKPGAILKDVVINGDLIIAEGAANGDITLNNVKVTGNTFIRGGGENSIHIIGGSYANLIIEKTDSGKIRVVTSDGAVVNAVYVDDGNDDVILSGRFESVTVNANVNLVVDTGSSITTLTAAAPGVNLTNNGSIGTLNVNADGVVVEGKAPDRVNVGSGVTVPPTDGNGNPLKSGFFSPGDGSAASGTYTITFHSDNGSVLGTRSVSSGSTPGTLPIPYKVNAIFLGWFTDKGDEVTGKTPITSSLNLYADYMPTTPPEELEEQTQTSVADVDPYYSVTVQSADPSMSASDVEKRITVNPKDDAETFDGIFVTGSSGQYAILALNGYTQGCSYSLTLTDAALTFAGRSNSIRTYNLTISNPDPVLNLRLDGSVIAIPASAISSITQNGEPVLSIFAPLLDMDGEQVQEFFGTFIYSGSDLTQGDKLAIYDGTRPDERVAGVDYSGQSIAYVTVTNVNGSVISYTNAEATEVLFKPDILPVNVAHDNDGIQPADIWDGADNSSITVDSDSMDYSGAYFEEMGLDASAIIESGDYLAFYTGALPNDALTVAFAIITGVTLDGSGNYIITYTPVTYEEMMAAMDMASSQELTYEQLAENVDMELLEEQIGEQFKESGFVEAAADFLMKLAEEDEAAREQVVRELGIRDFSVIRSEGVTPMTETATAPTITFDFLITNELEHFASKDGLRCVVTVTCVIPLGDNASITVTGSFEQEIGVNFSISSKAVWKVYGIFPYIADYRVNASLDVYNYTGLKLNALVTTDGSPDLDVSEKIEELKAMASSDGGSVEDAGSAVREFYEIYQEMLSSSHDYIDILNIPLISIQGAVDPLYIIAFSFKTEFVVSVDACVSLGAEFGYEKATRYCVSLIIFEKTATTSETELIDGNYGFTVYVMGTLGLRAGLRFTLEVGLFSVNLNSIGFTAEIGAYWRFWGFVYYQLRYANGRTTSTSGGACYMELGVYLEVNFIAQLGNNAFSYVATLYEHEWPLLTIGSRYYVYDFAYEAADNIRMKKVNAKQLPDYLFTMKQMDLYTGYISEQKYAASYFNLEIDINSYMHVSSSGYITVEANGTQRRLERNVGIMWKGGPLSFSSVPLSRTVNIKWDDLESGYYIDFVTNGGEPPERLYEEPYAPITLPIPNRLGYEFMGWYLDEALTRRVSMSTMPTSNITLYADWQEVGIAYTVYHVYERPGYSDLLICEYYTSWGGVATVTPEVKNINSGVYVSPAPQTINLAETKVVFYEYEYFRYTLTFNTGIIDDTNGDGVIDGDDSQTVVVQQARQGDDISRYVPYLYNYGFTFLGWDKDINQPAYSDMTFTASWSLNEYSIIYDLRGGSPVENPVTYSIYTGEITLINPTRPGFDFAGWVGTGLAEPTINVTIPAGSVGVRVYTAIWTRYAITYDLAGGNWRTGYPNMPGYTSSQADTHLYNPVRDGYLFAGWTGTDLTGPTMNVVIPHGSEGDRSYTATWIPAASYTVSHYREAPDGSYTLYETQTLIGAVGSLTEAAAKWYQGYTAQPFEQIAIDQGGTANVEIRYGSNGYRALFFANGGMFSDGSTGTGKELYFKTGAAIQYPGVTRAGFTFTGWTPGYTVMPANDTQFYAQWTPLSYTISYDLNGGSIAGGSNPTSYTTEQTIIFPGNPSKAGAAFAGWIDDATGLFIAAGSVAIPYGSIGDKRFTAAWEDNYTITYDLAGGDVASGNPTSYSILSADITLKNPYKAYYVFAGWNNDTTGLILPGAVAIPKGSTGDRQFTAVWTPVSYTIAYSLGTGGNYDGIDHPTSYTRESGDVTLVAPARPGYVFEGWIYEGMPDSGVITAGSTGNRTYTAIWRVGYTITYILAGGSFEEGITPPASFTSLSGTVTIPNPVKQGYVFDGWTGTGILFGMAKNLTFTASNNPGNKEYTANWTPVSYTINYNLAGGSAAVSNPESYTIESDDIALSNPTREGYTFAGWTGTDLSEATPEVTIETGSTGDRTYTATWTAIDYDITYELDGGNYTDIEHPTSYTAAGGVALVAPVKSGYTFAGWTGTGLAGQTMSVTIPAGSTGARTYTATWTPVNYAIS